MTPKYHMMSVLIAVPLILIGIVGVSYAEPFEQIDTRIIYVAESNASIEIAWNHDDAVLKYDVGCVSCMPNPAQFTLNDFVVLSDVSTFNDGHVILYVVAYNTSNEIITAKQILLLLR